MDKKIKEAAVAFHVPPKMVHNERGETVEVILNYEDYKGFLQLLADYVDWEAMPGYLQDMVDHVLAEEARLEQGDEAPVPLSEVLIELGIDPDETFRESSEVS